MRRHAVAFARWLRRRGTSPPAAAARLQLAERTLRHWCQQWKEDRLRAVGRGRPLKRASVEERNRAVEILVRRGPHTGVGVLLDTCPGLGRNEAVELKGRVRRALHRHHSAWDRRLVWTRAGAVWAADWTDPPVPIEGSYPKIFAARDLASGRSLRALATASASGAETAACLKADFLRWGAPLVLKMDNGSPFTSRKVGELLDRWMVVPLYSPPGIPSYNGAIEAGIGAMKTRLHHLSAAAGRPGLWTCGDLEIARHQANTMPHVHIYPEQKWERQTPITKTERASFRKCLENERLRIESEKGPSPNKQQEAWRKREAITHALTINGYLKLTRRRISPPITSRLVAKIS